MADGWQPRLRAESVPEDAIAAVAPSFALAGTLAEDASAIVRPLEDLRARFSRRRRSARLRSA